MKKLEYSQIAKRNLKALRIHLLNEYGPALSKKIIKQITSAARGLETLHENFMYKLFGISTTSQETLDYWGEEI